MDFDRLALEVQAVDRMDFDRLALEVQAVDRMDFDRLAHEVQAVDRMDFDRLALEVQAVDRSQADSLEIDSPDFETVDRRTLAEPAQAAGFPKLADARKSAAQKDCASSAARLVLVLSAELARPPFGHID